MNPSVAAPTKPMRHRAAEWLALRHARPFTLKEEADLGDWLAEDARHAAAYAELAAAWKRFDRLSGYPHSADVSADPDLLATNRRSPPWRRPLVAVAAAAAVVLGVLWFAASFAPTPEPSTAVAMARVFRLSDGSLVDLNSGGEVRERFTVGERRVELLRGEAHFAVVKNPQRPFIVETDGVSVRAVGTAFNVRVATQGVEVLVTEGTVEVARTNVAAPGVLPAAMKLHAGESTRVATGGAPVRPAVETVSAVEMERRLAWQSQRLFFDDLPLSEVVARFNRHAAADAATPRLTILDPQLAELRISGRLRADDLEAFVEVLQSSFGVTVERSPEGSVQLRGGAAR